MPSACAILGRLKNCDSYLRGHPKQPAAFEELVCQALATTLHVPFYDRNTDKVWQKYKVTWYGKSHPAYENAWGGPDGIAHGCDFCLVIEATLKTGKKQWTQEFNECFDHRKQVISNIDENSNHVHVILITKEIHSYTYNSLKKTDLERQYKIVPIEIKTLQTLLETSLLAFTIKNAEVIKLFSDLWDALRSSKDLADFQDLGQQCAKRWQFHVLALEKAAVIAVKSYRTMRTEKADQVAAGQILNRLIKQPVIRWYMGRMGKTLEYDDIVNSLEQEGLGIVIGKNPYNDEHMLCPVPLADFRSRCRRRLEAVEKAYGTV